MSRADPTPRDRYLREQLITYIGNKRALLGFIDDALDRVRSELGHETLAVADLFSGSGAVARLLKMKAHRLVVNDLERYSEIINRCYLSNACDRDEAEIARLYRELTARLERDEKTDRLDTTGIIARHYAPVDDRNIQPGERVFYTRRNARYIDTARRYIEELPPAYRPFFLAPLLAEASIHANTAGVFKGFYKDSRTGIGRFGGTAGNALSRITGDIHLPYPVFSSHDCEVQIYREDANSLVPHLGTGRSGVRPGARPGTEALGNPPSPDRIPPGPSEPGGPPSPDRVPPGPSEPGGPPSPVDPASAPCPAPLDLVYLDPPYNQHPYGSNYFMLNVIAEYREPRELSRVSGIPRGWNRSAYNSSHRAVEAFAELVCSLPTRYILVSFNSEGFLARETLLRILKRVGSVEVLETRYNTFRGSRNLQNRAAHVTEYLFLVRVHSGGASAAGGTVGRKSTGGGPADRSPSGFSKGDPSVPGSVADGSSTGRGHGEDAVL